MGLLSLLKRFSKSDSESPGALANDAASPEIIRVRARRRLIGSAVLVALAVVLLPLVFDTKPRPLSVDIPIDLPRREGVAVPAPPPPRLASVEASAPSIRRPVAEPPQEIVETAPAKPAPASASASNAAEEAAKKAAALKEQADKDAARKESAKQDAANHEAAKQEAAKQEAAKAEARKREAAKAEAAKAAKAAEAEKADKAEKAAKAKAAEAARAKAALEGKEAAPASTRFVVQVGAYEQASAVREVRQRVEKLGLSSFQQEVDTSQGKRIRVRLGPYKSREEAEKAQAKLAAQGIRASVIPL